MKILICTPTHNTPQEKIDYVAKRISEAVGEGHTISRTDDKNGEGKGWALRECLKAADADYYIFIDGDGDIDPIQIVPVMFYLTQGYDVVVGKKELPKKLGRRILTYLSRAWIKLLFGVIVDTQTGIKGFNYKPFWQLNGWAFDIEVLWRARRMKKKILEIPMRATVSSGKSLKDIFSTWRDTIVVRFGL